MFAEYRTTVISFVVGLIINLISFYLFTIKAINNVTLIFIIEGLILLILMIGIQTKYNELKGKLEEMKIKYKELNESLKINERLIKVETKVESYGKNK